MLFSKFRWGVSRFLFKRFVERRASVEAGLKSDIEHGVGIGQNFRNGEMYTALIDVIKKAGAHGFIQRLRNIVRGYGQCLCQFIQAKVGV